MTIWSVSMGSAGMFILLLTNLSSQRDAPPDCGGGPTPRGWSRPGKRTTDQGRFLTSLTVGRRSQLRAQRRNCTGFPLNRPRRA